MTNKSILRGLCTALCAATLPVSTLTAQAGDPPSRVARISALDGSASFQPAGATEWSEAARNYTVTTGDRIFTSQGARMELEVGPMSLRLSADADVTMTNLEDHFMQVGVAQGTVRLSVYRISMGDTVEVDTPNGAVIVTRPGEYRIDVPANDRFSVVVVDAGAADVIGPGIYQELRSGQAVQLSGSDPIRAVSIPRPPMSAFDQWGADRDRRATSSGCSRYMNNDIPGCADLDESGRWETNPEYGAVWYPTHVAVDWVPYRDGRWVWIEPWGWSWVDDAPWGYAPFHYGRWARFGPTWGWVPGPREYRPYYAPALVAFVGGSGWSVSLSMGAQAWFPLGPREAYIPSYHHDDVYLRQINVTNMRNVNVTNITTIINVQTSGRQTYANRSAGVTAVPTETFRSGRPVAHDVFKLKQDDVDRAQVISHANTAPVERAVFGGRPAARPPIASRPDVIITANPRRDQNDRARGSDGRDDRSRGSDNRGRGGDDRGRSQTPPTPPPPPPQRGRGRGQDQVQDRGQQPPDRRTSKTEAPPTVTQTPPPSPTVPPIPPTPPRGRGQQDSTRVPRPLVTQTPPPPVTPPFKAREPALKIDPGKPLEPQQTRNVQAGKDAGPPKDKEVLPHPPAPPAGKPVPPPPAGKGRGKADSTGRGRGRGGE